MMEECDKGIQEYLGLVVSLSSEIAPRFNRRNSPIFQKEETQSTQVPTVDSEKKSEEVPKT